MFRSALPASLLVAAALALSAGGNAAAAPSDDALAKDAERICGPRVAEVNCAWGRNRQVPGGGEKVPHDNGFKGQQATRKWPKLTGVLWQVLSSTTPRTKTGGRYVDELLGHHGNEILIGGAGDDILWGDWDPKGNTPRQRNVLRGGAGNDWLYPSHGRDSVSGGPGNDYVWAYYGRGRITCGPGRDTVRVRTPTPWKVASDCEVVTHFCGFGFRPDGKCKQPSVVLTAGRRG